MSAQRRIDAFFTLADRGLRTANVLFRENLFEDATLYVQQVVERVARALLTHAGVAFGTSHNLAQMAEALPLEHPFRERIRAFDAPPRSPPFVTRLRPAGCNNLRKRESCARP
jgi:HEPN domain-containing protein